MVIRRSLHVLKKYISAKTYPRGSWCIGSTYCESWRRQRNGSDAGITACIFENGQRRGSIAHLPKVISQKAFGEDIILFFGRNLYVRYGRAALVIARCVNLYKWILEENKTLIYNYPESI